MKTFRASDAAAALACRWASSPDNSRVSVNSIGGLLEQIREKWKPVLHPDWRKLMILRHPLEAKTAASARFDGASRVAQRTGHHAPHLLFHAAGDQFAVALSAELRRLAEMNSHVDRALAQYGEEMR